MIDPAIQIDPFDPPARPRPCPQCNPPGVGRLWVEPLGDRRRVWCDECGWAQLYDARGPIRMVERPEPPPTNARRWNRCRNTEPLHTQSPPQPDKEVPVADLKTCPLCGKKTQRLRKATGKCYKCSIREQNAITDPRDPGYEGNPLPPAVADPVAELSESIRRIMSERFKLIERIKVLDQALADAARLAAGEAA